MRSDKIVKMKTELPSPAFSNAMNKINASFDFRQWRKSPEWKIFVAGYNEAVRVANDNLKAQYDMWQTAERLFGAP